MSPLDLMPDHLDVTFFTISDSLYFIGTVALLNSLRLTLHRGTFVVLDAGLSPAQRARLEAHATVVDLPVELTANPTVLKAYASLFDQHGVSVIIDSDMIVARSLGDVIERARAGKISVVADPLPDRWFEEWSMGFGLRKPLRRQKYVNAGLVALSTEHWPDFLQRWWELCERIPTKAAMMRGSANNPFWAADQDALNALLMSEMPRSAVEVLPPEYEVHPGQMMHASVVDASTLRCTYHGNRLSILHYSMQPKAWQRSGWVRVRRDAYVRLFPRVVCGDDVLIQLMEDEVPLWLRPNAIGLLTLMVLDISHGIADALLLLLPTRASAAVRRTIRRLAGSSRW